MCLQTFNRAKLAKLPQKGIGYKVFAKNELGYLDFPHFPTDKRLTINKTIVPDEISHIAYGYCSGKGIMYYPGGFHLFLSKKSADEYCWDLNWVVRKVEWADPVACGTQKGLTDCIVVRKMKILPLRSKE